MIDSTKRNLNFFNLSINRLKKYYSPCEVSLKLRLQPETVDNSVYKSLSETTKPAITHRVAVDILLREEFGAETRLELATPTSVVLYQLSYSRLWSVLYSTFKFWSGNGTRMTLTWQGRALPTELFPLGWSVLYSTFQILERETRLELATPTLRSCSTN